MRQLRVTLEYDGTELSGWQRQANAPTVQAHVEEALARVLGHPVRVSGASRTDAGVHARGQVAAFSTDRTIPLEGLRRALNTELPGSISAVELIEADPSFHPRFSATGKHYRYLIWACRDRAPRWRLRAWHRQRPLDLPAMQAAAEVLRGEHDFSAFRAVGCASKSARRRMEEVRLDWLEPSLLALDVRGNAFLRNMMRIMAGTLVDVGEGRFTPEQVAEILASRDRTRGGQTAPAHGLELMRVFYDGTRIGTLRPPAPTAAPAEPSRDPEASAAAPAIEPASAREAL